MATLKHFSIPTLYYTTLYITPTHSSALYYNTLHFTTHHHSTVLKGHSLHIWHAQIIQLYAGVCTFNPIQFLRLISSWKRPIFNHPSQIRLTEMLASEGLHFYHLYLLGTVYYTVFIRWWRDVCTTLHCTILHYTTIYCTPKHSGVHSRGSLVISPDTMEHELFSLPRPGAEGWGSLVRKNIDCNVPLLLEYSTRV